MVRDRCYYCDDYFLFVYKITLADLSDRAQCFTFSLLKF